MMQKSRSSSNFGEGGGEGISSSTSDHGSTSSWWNKFVRRRPLAADNDDASVGSVGSMASHHSHHSHSSRKSVLSTSSSAAFDSWGLKKYHHVLRTNRNYRLYLCSHICQHTGDGFVHVASLIAIEQMVPDSGTAISILVATKMIPMILLTSFGGALADWYDRRHLMISLDAWNASVALLYLVALYYESPTLLYIVSFVRHSVVAMYEPVTRSIVPLLVKNDEELKCAMTMNGMAWAITLAVGGLIAGWSAATWGVGACYVLDSFTYVVSTVMIWMVTGRYCVRVVTDGAAAAGRSCVEVLLSPITYFFQMFAELMNYLATCGFGMLVLLKATGNITVGTADIINVHFAHVEGDEMATSANIGYIYSAVGLGCLLGPIAANCFTDMSRPGTLQLVCIFSLVFVLVGWMGMAQSHYNHIGWLCLFNCVRAFGSSIIFINSTLILQKLTTSEMLGRMLSFDFAITMLCDTITAFVAGIHQDSGVAAPSDVAMGAVILVGTLWVCWLIYHILGRGAAAKNFNKAVVSELAQPLSVNKELERLGDYLESGASGAIKEVEQRRLSKSMSARNSAAFA